MQLKKFFQATVLVTAFASFPLPSFASDSDAITSSLANLGHQVQKTRNAFEQYDGGAFSTLPLAAELYKVMTASTAARKSFEDSEPLAVDETPQVIEQYHNVRASIEEALQSVPSKADYIDSSGVRFMTVALLQAFASQRKEFEKASKAKIPKEQHHLINGPVDSLAVEFDNALDFFQ